MDFVKFIVSATMSGQNSFYLKSDSIMITKSNTLVEACYDLSVAKHDLMTLAINKMHKLNSHLFDLQPNLLYPTAN
jgi:hypothetical protein